MGDFWTNPVRHPEDTGYGQISREFDLAEVSLAAGLPIGALEAGTVPYHCHVTIVEAFNAATTNVLVVGTTDDDDGFAVAAGTAAGATGLKDNLKGALSGLPLAGDKVVYAKFTQTGTAATAGKAIVTLLFRNKREVVGRPWPQNV